MPKFITASEEDSRKTIGGRILRLREDAELSGDELARKVRIAGYGGIDPDRKTVHKWESGEAPLSPPLLEWIAEALHVTPQFLASGDTVLPPFAGARFLSPCTDREVSVVERRTIETQIRVLVRQWWSATERKHWPKFFAPCPKLICKRSGGWTERVAECIREKWGVGSKAPIQDLSWTLAENAALVIRVTKLGYAFESAVVYGAWFSKVPCVIWVGPSPSSETEFAEYRFRLLVAVVRLLMVFAEASSEDVRKHSEPIARAILMPGESLACSACNRVTENSTVSLAGRYGLPAEQVARRLVERKLLDVGHQKAWLQRIKKQRLQHTKEAPWGTE